MVQVNRSAVDATQFPDIADLLERLHFSPADGRIWLGEQRMLLLHSEAMGVLRRELIESLGIDRARGLLTRMGYFSGARDAQLARKVRPNHSPQDMFVVGPQLHCLEGIVSVEPIVADIDVERGKYYGEYLWKSSSEDDQHIAVYGIGAEPACWMQIGYASGYTSEFMGRPVLFREIDCRAMGRPHCRIIGQPVEAWGEEGAHDARFLKAEAFATGLSVGSSTPVSATAALGAVRPRSAFDDDHIVGASSGFNSVCHMVRRVASTQATVLFLGESGVGKEVFARVLHRIGPRSGKPFIALNCAAIPETLIEAELFGVEKGAYTGALQSRMGRFERADGGDLFLDEIGSLSLTAQGKLLRALQEGEIERVGDTQTRHVDVRVVAATNLNLLDEVRLGRFREDLYFRLNVFPIRVPALRERREDIPLLMNFFLAKFSRRHGRDVTGFTPRAIDAMLNYDWPGNVRELENVIERGVILGPEGGAVDVSHLFTSDEKLGARQFGLAGDGSLLAAEILDAARNTAPESRIERVTKRVNALLLGVGDDADPVPLEEIEAVLLQNAVQRAHGNLSAAARMLGVTRPQLVYRLKTRGIAVEHE